MQVILEIIINKKYDKYIVSTMYLNLQSIENNWPKKEENHLLQ